MRDIDAIADRIEFADAVMMCEHDRLASPFPEDAMALVGEVVRHEDAYRLCYIRGPEGILIGLAQELGQRTSR